MGGLSTSIGIEIIANIKLYLHSLVHFSIKKTAGSLLVIILMHRSGADRFKGLLDVEKGPPQQIFII